MKRNKKVPIFQEYQRLKQEYPNYLVFLKLGDFYETFASDAIIFSDECDVILFRRGEHEMAGFPCYKAEHYAQKLVARGYAVALAEPTNQLTLFSKSDNS